MALPTASVVPDTHRYNYAVPPGGMGNPVSTATSYDSQPVAVTFNKAQLSAPDVNINIDGRPLSTRADDQFQVGMDLWVDVCVGRDCGNGAPGTVYTGWHLNWCMRQAAFYHNQDAAEQALSRKRKDTDPEYHFEKFPRTIEEFCKRFRFLGYIAATRVDDNRSTATIRVNKRKYSVQTAGDINNVINVWAGDLRLGDRVGFKIGWETVGTSDDTTWEGESARSARFRRDLPIIQIRPWHDDETGSYPICDRGVHSSQMGEIVNRDLHMITKVTKGGMKVRVYEPPHYIVVGKIMRLFKPITQTDSHNAMLHLKGSNKLAREFKLIDLALVQQTSRIAT